MMLIYRLYLNAGNVEKKYSRLFWGTQITIIGMLFTFPFVGYALFSITFSTLFIIATYFFTWLVFKNTPDSKKQSNSYKCIRISLWFMVISSIGPWALGIIMNTAGSNSDLYRNAIYFYLHFQYNGWFIVALFGLLFYFFEQHNLIIPKRIFQQFFWLFNIGVVFTYGISLLWMNPNNSVYLISSLGGLLQLVAFGILVQYMQLHWRKIKNENAPLFIQLLRIIGVILLIKLLIQFLGTFHYFSSISSLNIDFIIGYLHWIFLGVVSISLLTFLYKFQFIFITKKAILFYVIGFVLTEGFIFYKGIVIWLEYSLIDHYFWYLIIVSCLFLLSITNIFVIQFKKISN